KESGGLKAVFWQLKGPVKAGRSYGSMRGLAERGEDPVWGGQKSSEGRENLFWLGWSCRIYRQTWEMGWEPGAGQFSLNAHFCRGLLCYQHIANHERVHLSPEKTVQGLRRSSYDRLILVE